MRARPTRVYPAGRKVTAGRDGHPRAAGQRREGRQAHKKKGRKRRAKKASAPITGIYDACSMSGSKKVVATCAERLAVLRRAGFDVVLNYSTDGMSLDDNLSYADLAHSQGRRVI